jgi:hypothetical protein
MDATIVEGHKRVDGVEVPHHDRQHTCSRMIALGQLNGGRLQRASGTERTMILRVRIAAPSGAIAE